MFNLIAGITKTVAGIGASGLAFDVAVKHIPSSASKIMKVVYGVGAVGLAGAAGDVAERYFDRQFKAVKAGIEATKEELRNQAVDVECAPVENEEESEEGDQHG